MDDDQIGEIDTGDYAPGRADRSVGIGLLIEALAGAQAEIKPPERNKTVQVRTKAGGKYSFTYADLAQVIEACRVPLTKHGLWVTQPTFGSRLVTTLYHSSGQWISTEVDLVLPENYTNQEYGSALTYMRRYQWITLLGMAADTDDDANAADGNEAVVADRGAVEPSVVIEPAGPAVYKVPTALPLDEKDANAWTAWAVAFKANVEATSADKLDEWLLLNQPVLISLRKIKRRLYTRLEENLSGIYTDGLLPPAKE